MISKQRQKMNKEDYIMRRIARKAGFDPSQERNPDGTWGSGGNVDRDETEGAQYEKHDPRSKPCFNEWFEGSKMVDPKSGEPLEFYHGTTHEFNEFKKGRGNIENDFGIGHYFSNNHYDVSRNYEGEGPDLKHRIERLAEQIQYDDDIDYEAAETKARKRMHGGANRVIPVYLSLKNPFILKSKGSETYFDYEYNEDINEETGSMVDLYEAMEYAAAGYNDVDTQQTMNDAFNAYHETAGSATAIIKAIRGSEGLMYATNNEGQLASNEIVRTVIENLGFDGIWDKNVGDKFPGMGLGDYTEHVIAFNPDQMKGVDNETFCDDTNYTKAGFNPTQRRDEGGKWTDNSAAMEAKEQEIKDLTKEVAVYYDEDGNELGETQGTKNGVTLEVPQGTHTLTHNHPNDSSFSRADIYYLLTGNIERIRAVGPNGTVYEMSLIDDPRTAEGHDPKDRLISQDWGAAKKMAKSDLSDYISKNYEGYDKMFWKEQGQVEDEAAKMLDRYSHRVNEYLANETETGKKYLKYKRYE